MIPKIIAVFVFLSSFTALFAQHHHTKNTVEEIDVEKQTCPFLTEDPRGNILLSWAKTKGAESVMCYAISKNKGLTFDDTVEIKCTKGVAPHGENLPKLICKPNGDMIAVWGTKNSNPKNKYSGLIFYTQSFDNGKNWSKPKPITTNPHSFDQRYFDVAVLKNGEAAVVWLDNPNLPEKEGSTLFYSSTEGKNGFQKERAIGETTCQCCRTDLLVDSRGNIHVAYRDILNDSIRDMVHSVSVDGGENFSKPKRISEDNWVIAGCPHTGPTMAVNDKGVHCAWFTKGGGSGIFYTSSSDQGANFNARQLLSENARHPQMLAFPNGPVGIVWEEEVKTESGSSFKTALLVLTADGKRESYKLNAGEGNCSFPVVLELDERTLIVAWAEESSNTDNKRAAIVRTERITIR